MQVCPFTGELYHGEILDGICDNCSKPCTYEEDAYGQNFLVICDECTDHETEWVYKPSRLTKIKNKLSNLRFRIKTYMIKIGLIEEEYPF
mgnify:CR=1 FL=1